jgi:hypothetical protein
VHTRLIVIAPHGGDIERHTDQQAERVASRLKAKAASSWRCKGFKEGGGASDRPAAQELLLRMDAQNSLLKFIRR